MKQKISYLQVLLELKEQYPAAVEIRVSYGGSGDSFDSFYEVSIVDGNNEPIDIDLKEGVLFMEKYTDILYAAVNATGDGFDNDGAEGYVVFDLVAHKVYAEHYQNVLKTEFDGTYYVEAEDFEEAVTEALAEGTKTKEEEL